MKRIVFSLIASTSCLFTFPGTGFTALKAIDCFTPDSPEEVKLRLGDTKAWYGGNYPLLIFDDSTEEVYSFKRKERIFRKLAIFEEEKYEDEWHVTEHRALMSLGRNLIYAETLRDTDEEGNTNTIF